MAIVRRVSFAVLRMWRSLKNVFYSFWTYADLSPDLRLRRRINRTLRKRDNLSATEWYQVFWQPLDIAKPVSDFVYTHMQAYSGLEFGCVQPSDRLQSDLHLSLVCWFDWELTFCADFLKTFDIDLASQFNLDHFETVEELVFFLNRQLLAINR